VWWAGGGVSTCSSVLLFDSCGHTWFAEVVGSSAGYIPAKPSVSDDEVLEQIPMRWVRRMGQCDERCGMREGGGGEWVNYRPKKALEIRIEGLR